MVRVITRRLLCAGSGFILADAPRMRADGTEGEDVGQGTPRRISTPSGDDFPRGSSMSMVMRQIFSYKNHCKVSIVFRVAK